MNKLVIFSIAVVIVVGGIVSFALQRKEAQVPVSQTAPTSEPQKEDGSTFAVPKKSAHYESNTPEHGIILAGIPINVVINFNFDLGSGSSIQIIKQGVGGLDYGLGETIIDANKLSMRRKMDSESPDQIYTVHYKACWVDGSCHDGSFQFKIDRKHASKFVDMRNKTEVTVDLKNTAFSTPRLRVSKGSKVTWINQDNVEHTINTDSHPAHTYYLKQNSKFLKNKETYSVTFDTPGIYLYHCTPHADVMKGEILVD